MANKKDVEFRLYAPDAKNVALAGDFNKWNPVSMKMKKDGKGTWKAKVALTSGRHEYKFVVDGNWWTDPACKSNTTNAMGSQNSVINV
ncbi:MAG: glycogen-binding domain-containing protein [Candidatus Omnitrophica bacterium]|nr:glycogen-binding domain-containing protein [Candidatus Omnitrophota bacterium]